MDIQYYFGYPGQLFLANRPFYFGIKTTISQKYIFSGVFTGHY